MKRTTVVSVSVAVVAIIALLTACQFGSGPVVDGRIAMPCVRPGGQTVPGWPWLAKPGAAIVAVAVVNSEVAVPLDAVYVAAPITVTTPRPRPMRVRVWDGHGSTGFQPLTIAGTFFIGLETADGSSPAGQTSWALAALDAQRQDVGFSCVSPSQG